MLASSASFLASTAKLAPGVAGRSAAPSSDGEGAGGFAGLLIGLSAEAAEGAAASDGPSAEPDIAGDATALASAVTAAIVPGQPATGSGKDLPVGLPEAAEEHARPGAGAAVEAAEALASDPSALLAVVSTALLEILPVGTGQRTRSTTASSQPQATLFPQAAAVAAAAVAGAGKPKSESQKAEQASAPTVSITVAAAGKAREAVELAGAEPAVRAKPTHAVDLRGADVPLAPPATTPPSVAQADQPASTAGLHVATVRAATTTIIDIDAALDHLVAAREAMMPAKAALAIDHAEFGEVAIRFEQSADGRLSAELAGADPELQRVVSAAVAAERGPATASDGDRPSHLANQRGAGPGSDAASGERSASGGDREPAQRRGAGRSQTHQPATDPHAGVFA